MKIAIVHSFYSAKNPSGENDVVSSQVDSLRNAGHDVRLFARYSVVAENQLSAVRAGVRVISGFEGSLGRELEDFKPDLVHVHNLFPNFGDSWLKACPFPVVTTVHNFRNVCAKATLFREGQVCTLCPDHSSLHAIKNRCYRDSSIASIPLAVANRRPLRERRTVKSVKRIIVLSRRLQTLFESYGAPSEKMVRIPNFYPRISQSPSDKLDKSWTYVGRLEPDKGILDLVQNWPTGHRLKVLGSGPLLEPIGNIGNPSIDVLGRVPFSEVPQAIRESEGLIFPSRYFESAPAMSYLAALSVGRPTLALEGNAVADDVTESGSGLTYEDYTDFGSLLDRIASTDRYGLEAKKRFESEFSEEIWLSRMIPLYDDVIREAKVSS